MARVVRPRVNHDVAAGRIAHQVAVGARPRHHAGIGRGQAAQVLQKLYRALGLPVQRVHDLPVRADQRQFAIRRFMLHVARLQPRQQAGARTGTPERRLGCAGLQHRIDMRVLLQPLQRADGRKDHEEAARLVPRQRVGGAQPDRLELLGFVRHRRLALGHAGHQKRHVKTARQIAVSHPVGQHKHLIGRQRQAARPALHRQRRLAVQRRDVCAAGIAAVAMARQQHAQLFKAFPDGRNRLCQVQIALAGASRRVVMHRRVPRIDAAARKDIGAGRKAGRHGTARHQHFQAACRIAQKQHGGGRASGRRFALRIKELGGSGHAADFAANQGPCLATGDSRKPPWQRASPGCF